MNVPADDELVFHLRLGDITSLEKDYKGVIEKYISDHNIVKVTFCTAFHYGNNYVQNIWMYSEQKHRENLRKVSKMFNELSRIKHIKIDVKSTHDIDDDFVFMCKAKYFEAAHGGFSNLIKQVRHTK